MSMKFGVTNFKFEEVRAPCSDLPPKFWKIFFRDFKEFLPRYVF